MPVSILSWFQERDQEDEISMSNIISDCVSDKPDTSRRLDFLSSSSCNSCNYRMFQKKRNLSIVNCFSEHIACNFLLK